MSWEFDYAAGNAIERRLRKNGKFVWRRGHVANDWEPRPGVGVRGTYDDDGSRFRVPVPEEIRHA
ncbi:MAG TPA: hypothetical protein VEW26_15790 [Allosphingosinicella sp.]|nr:hypothetical protein [Allosphingosinicella sp.]